ncbi:heterokaryon incompatibility protein-domain-containing protein [Stachybotrys elegans]|uniref:Heterokaryon incompatibility protein-domain-containing protein n=1 Tax=Stachybotrys elegans TaxID=80388 RepID=A0A8K0WU40_9HYPO|nr:heterokaryon incompatibility protein-domain-containing protein [Stachybotrys elegans]
MDENTPATTIIKSLGGLPLGMRTDTRSWESVMIEYLATSQISALYLARLGGGDFREFISALKYPYSCIEHPVYEALDVLLAMTEYQYLPLKTTDDSIRLLQLRKGTAHDDVTCLLFETSLHGEGLPYQALSYSWRDDTEAAEAWPGHTRCIRINSLDHFVTESLHLALQRVRRLDRDIILWVDAICINQDDMREKGHQVKQMGDVYKTADEVIIWLGPSDDSIDALMELIVLVDQHATEAYAFGTTKLWSSLCQQAMAGLERELSPEVRLKHVHALEALLRRSWFSRVWVLQEVAKARNATAYCGSSSCAARTFALMPSLLGVQANSHVQAVLDILPRLRNNTWWSSTRSLHDLMIRFEKSEASVQRDRIYALLGLSEDACDPVVFYPCYEKDDLRVCQDTAHFILFGEIRPAAAYTFPPMTLGDLYLPRHWLAGSVLDWAMSKQEGIKTAQLLVDELNRRGDSVYEVATHIAAEHSSHEPLEIRAIPSPYFTIEGEKTEKVLKIVSNQDPQLFITSPYPLQQRNTLSASPLRPPILPEESVPTDVEDLLSRPAELKRVEENF